MPVVAQSPEHDRYQVQEPLSPADRLTWELGANGSDPWLTDRRFRARVFSRVPVSIGVSIALRTKEIYSQKGRYIANRYLASVLEKLPYKTVNLATSEEAISTRAANLAHRVRKLGDRLDNALLVAHDEAVDLPMNVTDAGLITRLRDPHWWQRALRRKHCRLFENGARELGVLSRQYAKYVSNESVERRRYQKARHKEFLALTDAVNELGEVFALADLVGSSTSTPSIRRAELMARIAGLEQYARRVGHVAEFLTLTAPGRMHSASGNRINKRFDGSSPKVVQEYLCQLWAQIRSKLKREGVYMYGFRVVEPHHDGTPHWHLLLFVQEKDQEALRGIVRTYALRDSGDEPGASKHRFRAESIDWSKGSAVGYIAKYISKNIDGFGLKDDEVKATERVDSWASCHGIRQFQQIGGPPVTVWRELRRIRTTIPGSDLLEEARAAADAGDFGKYFESMGGWVINQRERPIRLRRVDKAKRNRYDEPVGPEVVGVNCDNVAHVSRERSWTLISSPSRHRALDRGELRRGSEASGRAKLARPGLEPRPPRLMGPPGQAAKPPWSPVNNCTHSPGKPICLDGEPYLTYRHAIYPDLL